MSHEPSSSGVGGGSSRVSCGVVFCGWKMQALPLALLHQTTFCTIRSTHASFEAPAVCPTTLQYNKGCRNCTRSLYLRGA